MLYELTLVYDDFKTNRFEVEESELNNLIDCIKQNKVYTDINKIVGFWLPPESLRCLYFHKKTTQNQEEPCQENPSSDQERDLTSSKEA